jgi:hypothetical protein
MKLACARRVGYDVRAGSEVDAQPEPVWDAMFSAFASVAARRSLRTYCATRGFARAACTPNTLGGAFDFKSRPLTLSPPLHRAYRHLAQQPSQQPQSSQSSSTPSQAPTNSSQDAVAKTSSPGPELKTAQPVSADIRHLTPAEQRRKDWAIVKRLAVNIWPANDWNTKGRVLAGLGLLVAGKVCSWFCGAKQDND